MWYSFDKEKTVKLSVISVDRVIEIQEKNKMGQKVQFLEDKIKLADTFADFTSNDGEESLDRFGNFSKSGRRRSKRKKERRRPGNES